MFFDRRRDGAISVQLPDELTQLIGQLVGELRDLLLGGDDDRLRRLYPTAYPQHEQLDREYHELMRGDLIEARLAALDTVEESLTTDALSDEQLTAWMQATNSMRLVLGTQLDVGEDDDPVPADHPQAPVYALYDLLNLLLSEMVEVLSRALPDG